MLIDVQANQLQAGWAACPICKALRFPAATLKAPFPGVCLGFLVTSSTTLTLSNLLFKRLYDYTYIQFPGLIIREGRLKNITIPQRSTYLLDVSAQHVEWQHPGGDWGVISRQVPPHVTQPVSRPDPSDLAKSEIPGDA